VWAAFESRDEVQKVRLASLLFDLEAMAREKQPRNRPVSHTVPHPLYFHITTSQRECRIQVRVIIVRTSDPAFNAYGGGGPPWRSIGFKMSPVRQKIPPWELMARATKYEPQVGASALGWRSLRMMYFLFYLLLMM